jgi:hypothetical protein
MKWEQWSGREGRSCGRERASAGFRWGLGGFGGRGERGEGQRGSRRSQHNLRRPATHQCVASKKSVCGLCQKCADNIHGQL